MTSYISKRILQFIPVWLGVVTIVFFMVHMIPGDPVNAITGGRPIPAELVEQYREQLGLNDPIYVQYWNYLTRTLHGDLGKSIASGLPVLQEISWRFPFTLQLAVVGLILAIPLGIVLGAVSAIKRGTWVDNLLLVGSLVFISIPGFWFALLLIYVFSVWLRLLPFSGTDGLKTLIMPGIVMALGSSAGVARLTRASMLEVLRSDYVRTARAKGLSERVVIYKHALRNALNPVITMTGLSFASLLGGAFIIENVFARPGIGRLAVYSIAQRDFPMIQGIVLYSATLFLVCNLLVDILYSVVDPRIRYR